MCLIKHTGDVTELGFSSMGLDSCHHTFLSMPHLETLLNETFVLSSFIMHKTISSPSSLRFTVDRLILCWLIHVAELSFPVKDLGRSSHIDSV